MNLTEIKELLRHEYEIAAVNQHLTEVDDLGNASQQGIRASMTLATLLGMLQRLEVADVQEHRLPMILASAALAGLQQALLRNGEQFPEVFGDLAQCTCNDCKVRWVSVLMGCWSALRVLTQCVEHQPAEASKALLAYVLSRQLQQIIYTYEVLAERLLPARDTVLELLRNDPDVGHWREFTDFSVIGQPWWIEF